jgi:sigma-E factor negative regulatory protein RseB
VVEVRRPGGGLAARFWIDAATKLPLRREMFDTNARMISEDAFTTLEFGTRGLNGMPASAAAPWTAQLDRAGLAALRGRGWPLPGQLPGNLVLLAASETSARPGPVINLSYSDGLAVVSLFVQRGELGRPMPGWRQITVGGRTVYSVDPAQRSFAWSADGFVYTVIADAPMATVGRVVTTLPGTSQPGFWTRMARGFRRLASWLNPLR